MSPLERAKARIGIADLWRVLNFPGEPRKSCKCPFHDERSASFSVFRGTDGGERWKCFAGCGEGDAVDFLARASNIDTREAARRFIALAGIVPAEGAAPEVCQRRVERTRGLNLPPLAPGSESELAALAELRAVSREGLRRATDAGQLWFADLRDGGEGVRAWLITDGARRAAQARRLDGRPWTSIGGAKAKTLPGSAAAWPIGIADLGGAEAVALCEGAPDFLAAWALIDAQSAASRPVAMIGAAQRLHREAIPTFAGKRVRIFPHRDPAGERAARLWTAQLREAGAARVESFALDALTTASGATVKDLNDFLRVPAEIVSADPELSRCMIF